MTERTRATDSEQSQKIISFNWREESVLRKQLSSLEAMKRQVETSFNLDQKLLYHHFQGRLQRAALTHTCLFMQRATSHTAKCGAIVDTRCGSTRGELRGGVWMTQGKILIRSGHKVPEASPGQVSTRRVWEPIRYSSQKASWQNRRRATSDTNAQGRDAISRRGTRLTKKAHPRSAAVNVHQAEGPWHKSGTSHMELITPTIKDESPGLTPTSAAGKIRTPSQERVLSVSCADNQCKSSCASSAPVTMAGSNGTSLIPVSRQNDLSERIRRFVQSAEVQTRHRGATSTPYNAQSLGEILGSGKRKRVFMDQLPCATEGDDEQKWRPTASRSLTMRSLDYRSSHRDIPVELLVLESYNALVTKENLEERKWMNNNPYNGSFKMRTVRVAPHLQGKDAQLHVSLNNLLYKH